MPLPFREEPMLPNNKFIAKRRLECLKRRFVKDSRYHRDYNTFMSDMITQGYAEEAHGIENGNNWYIPHHGVYHHKKPDKIRVVFDCATRCQGTSLNDQLLQGPDILNPLIGVLCRFREDHIAIMCDVEKMFYRFRVNKEDRKYLKFLWWKDGIIESEPVTYQMNVHIFGAISSPCCANFALKKLATDNQSICNPSTYTFINRNFYVDDGLASIPSVQEAIALVQDAIKVCSTGQLRLHKFVSNSRDVLECIPKSERATSLTNLDLDFERLPIERVLGVNWCAETDMLQFSMTVSDISKKRSRRDILSIIASLYDPLGLLSPFVLVGKQVLQQMCQLKMGWDAPVAGELEVRWIKWLSDLHKLGSLNIPRGIRPVVLGKISRQELHHFSDASTNGYGTCSYLRVIDEEDKVYCSLVIGKARVAPTKIITIPRLELTAALLSVKMSVMLHKELTCQIDDEYFWTDSKIVLSYLNNNAKRFHIFVANRIQQIKDHTTSNQWHYVPSEENPADHASRGLSASELSCSTWLKGPTFLRHEELPTNVDVTTVLEPSDPNVRAHVLLTRSKASDDFDISRLSRFSSWHLAQRAMSVCIRYVRILRARVHMTDKKPLVSTTYTSSTLNNITEAEMVIFKIVQQSMFSDELTDLRNGAQLSRGSKLYKLDAFIDEVGIIRVGGRLKRSMVNYVSNHPIVVARASHVTELIIRYHHNNVSHQGRGFTMNEIRKSGIWILGCSRAVSSYIYRCVTCRRIRGSTSIQKMSDLPEVRVHDTPPFTHVGLDCFGPFIVKEGRRDLKKYGLIVTCMASRAVHIEVTDDMTTDTFLNGLRCVIAIRGHIQSIRCDQGSNFIGADRELRTALLELKEDNIRSFLQSRHCEFVFNSPDSSHMGGVWERHIRTIRSILNTMLYQNKYRLDVSSLRTFLYEVMAIINGRPLTVQNLSDPNSLDPLTPNHILTMKSNIIIPPPGNFTKEDVYLRKRWRRVQFITNEFWSRWRKEYLVSLQPRQKWLKTQRNFGIGDIVLLKDVNTVRGEWSLAKVKELLPTADGLVRRVKIVVGDSHLRNNGTRISKLTVLERPIHKLVLLLEACRLL